MTLASSEPPPCAAHVPPAPRWRAVGLGVSLALVTVALYWPVRHFEFINSDDPDYVSANPIVQHGLTLEGVTWAFTTLFDSNWHPLTWLSHMLDCALFGVNPGAHHLVNVFFHVLGTLLLFLALARMTRAPERSAVVAALFAWHPLHVESVAWVAERKDGLSAVFWMLTLWAYARYVECPRARRFLLVLLCFALGLMAKPMIVTLPFVLLLLDHWPLGRAAALLPRVREKLPLFLLSAASCAITFVAQQQSGSVESMERFPLGVRVANALVAYASYLGKMLLPERLCVLYPHHGMPPAGSVIGAALVLVVVSLLALALRRRAPYVAVGWLWYLGTLVPVIGLVQVGVQSMADRYTYVPLVGLFIAGTWAVADVATGWPHRRTLLGLTTGTALAACLVATAVQLGYWRSSETVFGRAVEVTTRNAFANYNLAQALSMQGRHAEALGIYEETLRIKPDHDLAHTNLGLTLMLLGRVPEAIDHYVEAIRIRPANAEAHLDYGIALERLGQAEAAAAELSMALRLDPTSEQAYNALGKALLRLDRADAASANFRAALRLRPDFAEAHFNLGASLVREGKPGDAVPHLAEAARLFPDAPEVHAQWGLALAAERRPREAAAQYREALRLGPDDVEVLNRLAWLLATHPDPELRNGAEAVQLAERACDLTGGRLAPLVGTLAAAYAETGRFEDAVKTAEKARDLAAAGGNPELAARIEKLSHLFAAGQPFRETP